VEELTEDCERMKREREGLKRHADIEKAAHRRLVCLPQRLSLTLSPTVSLSVSPTVSSSPSLSPSLPLCRPHRVSHCVSLTVSPTVSPSLCLPLCLPHRLSHCVSLTVSIQARALASPSASRWGTTPLSARTRATCTRRWRARAARCWTTSRRR
jgi:hypothetical protein